MSTSIILLDQNFNANDVDIMVFEPCVLFSPRLSWGGGIDDMVPCLNIICCQEPKGIIVRDAFVFIIF